MRRDLTASQQAVQACHACIEAARTLLPHHHEHPHLVLIGVKSEQQLRQVLRRLDRWAVSYRPFFEADLGNQLTAAATEPISGPRRSHFRKYRCLRVAEEFL